MATFFFHYCSFYSHQCYCYYRFCWIGLFSTDLSCLGVACDIQYAQKLLLFWEKSESKILNTVNSQL